MNETPKLFSHEIEQVATYPIARPDADHRPVFRSPGRPERTKRTDVE
ncbi:hypothetical protein [Nocardia arizonensis]|nr:hypothetical protein [Nocardia arizonensis]